MASRITACEGPPPELGRPIFERDIPTNPALIAPLVIRAVELLKSEGLVMERDESKIGMCLEEALQNAVKHGNKGEFRKTVRFRIFRREAEWGAMVSDEGDGFDLSCIPDPLGEEGLWGESGRGLYLISHYMDRAELYNGGSTVVMARRI